MRLGEVGAVVKIGGTADAAALLAGADDSGRTERHEVLTHPARGDTEILGEHLGRRLCTPLERDQDLTLGR